MKGKHKLIKKKTDEELCEDFVKLVHEEAKETKEAATNIDFLESFFFYDAFSLKSDYIPRKIRDMLREKGITLHKSRRSSTVIVKIDKEVKK